MFQAVALCRRLMLWQDSLVHHIMVGMHQMRNQPGEAGRMSGPSGGEGRAWPLPVSSYGAREIIVITLGSGVLGVGLGFVWAPATVVVTLLWLALLAFFRDPTRSAPSDRAAFVAPADGKVTEITRIEHDDRLGGPAVKVGIFLSVFNVHINRSPCEAVVRKIDYKAGQFRNAMSPESSDDNEANTVVMDGGGDMGPFVVKQIAGLIARRIVCAAKVGDALGRGQRFGMIKFGSRTELVISRPDEVEITARVGDKVRAGRTIVARRRSRG
jgi:phosphatidylserine decarboxylase